MVGNNCNDRSHTATSPIPNLRHFTQNRTRLGMRALAPISRTCQAKETGLLVGFFAQPFPRFFLSRHFPGGRRRSFVGKSYQTAATHFAVTGPIKVSSKPAAFFYSRRGGSSFLLPGFSPKPSPPLPIPHAKFPNPTFGFLSLSCQERLLLQQRRMFVFLAD